MVRSFWFLIILVRMHRRWNMISSIMKRMKQRSWRMIDVRIRARPIFTLRDDSLLDESLALATPFPVIMPIIASSPIKVVRTRPG